MGAERNYASLLDTAFCFWWHRGVDGAEELLPCTRARAHRRVTLNVDDLASQEEWVSHGHRC